MIICITTLGRVHNQLTLKSIPVSLLPYTRLIVQHQEYRIHKEVYDNLVIIPLPDHIDNLGETRRFLLERYPSNKILLLDDDMVFYRRPHPESSTNGKIVKDPQDLEPMFDWVNHRLDTYAHVSISMKQGNNNVETLEEENGRYCRFLGYNTGLFPPNIPVGRVNGMSDFDLNLLLLRAGKPSCINFEYAQDHKGTQTPGGCSLNRTHATHEEEIAKMVIWHKGLVKVREKKNKGGGEFGSRKELTIYWKKAFQTSRESKL